MGSKKKKESALSYQGKQPHKGQKCMRGEPIYYEELKERISVMLTPTAISKLTLVAQKEGLSRSEFLERMLRKM